MRINAILIIFAVNLLTSLPLYASQLDLVLEAGAVWQHRNDVRITPSTGTLLELDQFEQGPFQHYRAEVFYHFNQNHAVRLLYAPFQISVSDTPETNINYNNRIFSAGQELTASYKFNSYRMSYIYQLIKGSSYSLKIGFTAKIRDAAIELQQGSTSESFTNLGFVPLLYLSFNKELTSSWSFFSESDFAAAPQGRAIDFTLKFRRKITENSMVGVGYRTLEGGADNDTVFTFSWFSYAVADLVITF